LNWLVLQGATYCAYLRTQKRSPRSSRYREFYQRWTSITRDATYLVLDLLGTIPHVNRYLPLTIVPVVPSGRNDNFWRLTTSESEYLVDLSCSVQSALVRLNDFIRLMATRMSTLHLYTFRILIKESLSILLFYG
jgi:hypothetical protein